MPALRGCCSRCRCLSLSPLSALSWSSPSPQRCLISGSGFPPFPGGGERRGCQPGAGASPASPSAGGQPLFHPLRINSSCWGERGGSSSFGNGFSHSAFVSLSCAGSPGSGVPVLSHRGLCPCCHTGAVLAHRGLGWHTGAVPILAHQGLCPCCHTGDCAHFGAPEVVSVLHTSGCVGTPGAVPMLPHQGCVRVVILGVVPLLSHRGMCLYCHTGPVPVLSHWGQCPCCHTGGCPHFGTPGVVPVLSHWGLYPCCHTKGYVRVVTQGLCPCCHTGGCAHFGTLGAVPVLSHQGCSMLSRQGCVHVVTPRDVSVLSHWELCLCCHIRDCARVVPSRVVPVLSHQGCALGVCTHTHTTARANLCAHTYLLRAVGW